MPSAKTFRLNGQTYVLAPGSRIVRRQRPGFARVVRENAQIAAKDFGLYQQIPLSGPLAIGQRQGNDIGRVWDQYNVIAMFPGIITRGPQRQSPTQTAIDSSFVPNRGGCFFEANGYLITFGDASGGTNGEPVYYFTSETWTDATLNADLTADVENIVGITFGEGYWWAVADQLQSDGSFDRITYKAVGSTPTPTVWERVNTDSANETLGSTPFTPDRLRFLEYAVSTRMSTNTRKLYSIAYENSTKRAFLTMKTPVSGAAWDDGTNQEMPSSSTPRGLKIFPGADGTYEVVAATNIGLFRGNIEGATQFVEELYRFSVPDGDYTGALAVGQDDALYFADGPDVKRLRWTDGNGGRIIDSHLIPLVPSDAAGDVTALAASQERPWIYVAKGGLAANKKARIYVYDIAQDAWFCIYQHDTANKSLEAMFESRADDGTPRLHFVDEDGNFYTFEDITDNPVENSSYKYATAGTIIDSERKPIPGNNDVGWMAIQVDADDLSANETVGILDGQDGTTPANEQTINSSSDPAEVWPDKTDASAGVGVAAKRQQVQIELDGTAGATAGPTIKQVAITYVAKGLLSDGTIPEEVEVVVDIDKSAPLQGAAGNKKNVRDNLRTAAQALTLVTLTLDSGESLFGEVFVAEEALDPVNQAAVQQAPAGGAAVVRFQQTVRGA